MSSGPARAVGSHGDGRLRVTFLDVGQGDAALVRFPNGSSMLVDAGGLGGAVSFDVGDRVVGPALRHVGVGRLASVVLTHGDADHVGGAPTIVREFRPWDVWEGVPVPPLAPLQRLRREAAAAAARWTTVQAGDTVAIDDVRLVVRHPGVPDWERQDVRNDDSIVLELLWRDVSFVFTGDIGREVEREIAGRFAPCRLRVVKVPHHGSPSSSSGRFVQALAPRVAVVSVGRGNRFGHPSKAVQERYVEAGALVFRTDRDGAVTVDTDGHSLDVRTFAGRTVHLSEARHEDAKSRRSEGRL
jgi:competence protein ComEC